jgi:hypothetical protein
MNFPTRNCSKKTSIETLPIELRIKAKNPANMLNLVPLRKILLARYIPKTLHADGHTDITNKMPPIEDQNSKGKPRLKHR